MNQIILVGEDSLCCALGMRLIAHTLQGWTLATEPIAKGGITKLTADFARYIKSSRHGPAVLCIADSDQVCPVDCVRQWLPRAVPPRFLLRLAVREAESWLLADRGAMQAHFRVPAGRLPAMPDACADPKRDLLILLNRFAPTALRREMVANVAGQLRSSTGYNARLREFVQIAWQPDDAAASSPSLRRAVNRLAELAATS